MGVETAHHFSFDGLPEPIIHRIQSLLSHKEAARTALLSKSWLGAWSTRPTIHLAQSHFPTDYYQPEVDPLTVFATTTFRRYEESNLSIDTFRLCLSRDHWLYSRTGLAAEWTLKALGMGATHLTFRLIKKDYDQITIPLDLDQVFRSENLVSLRLERFDLNQASIKCSGLKSLTLKKLQIPNDSYLHALVSSCPLLQNLSLSHVKWEWDDYDYDFDWINRRRCKVKPDVRQDARRSTIRLPKLTSLVLHSVMFEIETFFLDDLSSKFPNLRTLSFEPNIYKEVISSRSIEALTLKMMALDEYNQRKEEEPRAEFDIPSIRKFTFVGSCMPELSFRSTLCDRFQSHVLIKHHGVLSTEWFCELSKFLSQLRGSKMHLCLRVHYRESFDYEVGGIKGLDVCEVEDLTMDTRGLPSLSFEALLDGLFRICRPMTITQHVRPPKDS